MVKLADLKRLQEERETLRRNLAALAKEAKAAARARAKTLQRARRISTEDLRSLLEEREQASQQPPARAANTTVATTTTTTVTPQPTPEAESTTSDRK
jgi:hypothetical protein